jgi:hypothetical protein
MGGRRIAKLHAAKHADDSDDLIGHVFPFPAADVDAKERWSHDGHLEARGHAAELNRFAIHKSDKLTQINRRASPRPDRRPVEQTKRQTMNPNRVIVRLAPPRALPFHRRASFGPLSKLVPSCSITGSLVSSHEAGKDQYPLELIGTPAELRSLRQRRETTCFVPRWIEELLARYNAVGSRALGDLRRNNGAAPSVLKPELLAKLRVRLDEPPPDGGLWTSGKSRIGSIALTMCICRSPVANRLTPSLRTAGAMPTHRC